MKPTIVAILFAAQGFCQSLELIPGLLGPFDRQELAVSDRPGEAFGAAIGKGIELSRGGVGSGASFTAELPFDQLSTGKGPTEP